MTDPTPNERAPIELEIEVEGTVEEVWAAIATGPGISSWYVPHEVDGREGGRAWASFGPGMDVDGRVAEWDPPHRVVFDSGTPGEGLAFEWLVEAKEGGSCVVRLVNSGFSEGDEWDDYYDAMTEGWGIFLANLQLHCKHFMGQHGHASLPMASWPGPRDDTWNRLTSELGIDSSPEIGETIVVAGQDTPPLTGTVVAATPHRLTLLIDGPAPGTGLIAAEGRGDAVEVSIWTYLYGESGAAAAAEHDPLWRAWLSDRA